MERGTQNTISKGNPMGIPEHYFKSVKQSIIMVRKGKQKKARLERLKNEIVDYVIAVDQCSASDIVHHLSNEKKMRNHGLTPRKIGLFIPRYLKGLVSFTMDKSTGKRIYHPA